MARFFKAVATAAAAFFAYVSIHYACAWLLPFGTNGNTICANTVSVVLILLVSLGFGRHPLKTIGGERMSLKMIPAAIGMGVGACFLVQLMMITIPFPDAWAQSYGERVQVVRDAPMAVVYASSVLVAPLVEELMFRGVIYRSLRGGMPTVAAMGITSVLFAVLHGTPMWMVYTFVFSLLLCLLYERTQSFWICAISHTAFNIMGQIPLGGMLPDAAVIAIFIAGLLALVISIWYIERKKTNTLSKEDESL